MLARLLLLLTFYGLAPEVVRGQTVAEIPSPESHFGFTPGADRLLADWHELLTYYERVAAASSRIALDTLGLSTNGLPLVMLTVTSPDNHQNLDEIRGIHLQLADPRLVSDSSALERIRDDARVVVLLTSHIHSTEVGAGQMPANLLYRLAVSATPDILEILERVVLLVIPSLNPDGTQMVTEWYREHVGTEFEGIHPIELYHPYIGHDNNRDWYAFTQVETRLVVEGAHNRWRPMIVHDIHQMEEFGPRMFVPPYVDPFERNVDPLLVTAINQLGAYMAADLSLKGLSGVATSMEFDLYSPARAYSHYHGGVRILSETASARLATPVVVPADRSDVGWASDASIGTMTQPLPWFGGEWGLGDIVRYQEEGALSLLTNAARNHRFWVDTFLAVNRNAVMGWADWPEYWIIPDRAEDRTGLDAMLRVLTMGSVEVHRAEGDFTADGLHYRAGSYVIPMNQPYASWANAMLEVQDYPEVRMAPGGPLMRPYDVTAHTLPLLMGAPAFPATEIGGVALSAPIEIVESVHQAPAWLTSVRRPRIGLYRGARESIAAGWTRWLFDLYGIEYSSLSDTDVRDGALELRFDVIVLQDQQPALIRFGWRPGQVPGEHTGGIGSAGYEALRSFVLGGGRLVAVESATDLAIDLFGLAINNRVLGLPASTFYVPGSIVSLEVEPSSPLATAATAPTSAWFWRTSRAFDVGHPTATILARYGSGNPRKSGWLTGPEHIAGRPAIVEARVGRGSVLLFGFQPNYRGHSVATWPLLFNALRW